MFIVEFKNDPKYCHFSIGSELLSRGTSSDQLFYFSLMVQKL
jgi:hypothetical protein